MREGYQQVPEDHPSRQVTRLLPARQTTGERLTCPLPARKSLKTPPNLGPFPAKFPTTVNHVPASYSSPCPQPTGWRIRAIFRHTAALAIVGSGVGFPKLRVNPSQINGALGLFAAVGAVASGVQSTSTRDRQCSSVTRA